MRSQVPRERISEREQMSTPVMIDHALRFPGCTGRVVQRNRIPLIFGGVPGVINVTRCKEIFVTFRAQKCHGTVRIAAIIDDEYVRGRTQSRHRLLRQLAKLGIDDQKFGFPMFQDVSHRGGVQDAEEKRDEPVARTFIAFSTAPAMGTPKWASKIAGTFGKSAATVSPRPIPDFANADASRQHRE